jgi:hypothetical protein
MSAPRTLVTVLLAMAPWVCAAQPEGELRIALGPSTLREAVAACADRFHLEYIAVGLSERREEPFVKAACLEELIEQVVATYGASSVGFDSVWFIDGRGTGPNRWEALRGTLPAPVQEALASAEPDNQWPAAQARLRELFEAYVGPKPQVAAGSVLVAPFEVPTTDAAAVQIYRLRRGITTVERLLSARPYEASGQVVLDPHRALLVGDAHKSISLIEVPKDWQTAWRSAAQGVPRPHLQLHAAPLVVQGDAHGLLTRTISVDAAGSGADILAAVAEQAKARLSGPQGLTGLKMAVRVKDMPLWVLLSGVSIASGFDVDLTATRPEYPFEAREGSAAALYSVSAPAQRLIQRRFGQGGLPFAMWAWLELSDAQREALEAEHALDLDEFSARQRWTWRHVLAEGREVVVWSELSRIDPLMADRGSVRGVFLMDAQGSAWAELRIEGGEAEGFPLGDAGAERPRSIMRDLLRTPHGLGLAAPDRVRVGAHPWTYGAREEARAHQRFGGEAVLLAGPEVGAGQ